MGDENLINGKLRSTDLDINAVNHFSHGMLLKLRKNAHKAHWSECSLQYLQSRLLDEVNELEQAISHDTNEAIISECYDVANFAMMIADNIRSSFCEKGDKNNG